MRIPKSTNEAYWPFIDEYATRADAALRVKRLREMIGRAVLDEIESRPELRKSVVLILGKRIKDSTEVGFLREQGLL